jgi:CheY-like chemotaxis protein
VCATVVSAVDAIERAVRLRPDVVLMDIRLAQGGSGIDAARELHAQQALRCIFLSANLDEAKRTALLPYEPIDFVGKPVLPVVLQRALKMAECLRTLSWGP